jgi:SAM-dependent methyltransferase
MWRAMVRGNLLDLPFDDGCFHFILCSHVLEHIDDDLGAMREIVRVMNGGGWGLIQSPVDINRKVTLENSGIIAPQDRFELYGHPDHVRLYGMDYADRLRRSGFNVDIHDYYASLDAGERRFHGLDESELIFICRPEEHAILK